MTARREALRWGYRSQEAGEDEERPSRQRWGMRLGPDAGSGQGMVRHRWVQMTRRSKANTWKWLEEVAFTWLRPKCGAAVLEAEKCQQGRREARPRGRPDRPPARRWEGAEPRDLQSIPSRGQAQDTVGMLLPFFLIKKFFFDRERPFIW